MPPNEQKPDTPSPFAPPQISLPKGGGAIRGLGEKFQTNPANGTGSLSVPLPLSKSRGEFQPSLALAYSSGAGNGAFGLGWTLGLPSISRRLDKGVPRYLPFARNAAQTAAADRDADIFLLSGSEDLVPVAADDDPWTAHRTSNGYFIRGYRPRIEGTFARIESWTRVSDGDTHWRTISRDNILTVYGEGPEARVADPADPARVFTWLICRSYDDRGNAIEYQYAAEGDDGVDPCRPNERFRSRAAGRYLKRILYGNREPHLLDPSTESARRCHLPKPAADPERDWLFEVVFDYGDEAFESEPPLDGFDRVRWTNGPLRPRPARLDPFSMSRAGFEIRTYRLCRRILVTHRMPEALGDARTLVRGLRLEYDERPNGTRLARVTQSGYRALGEHRYRERSLPALLMHYSASPLDDPAPRAWTVRELPQDSLDNLPAGIAGQGYQWTDLDGEGVAGVLSAQAGAWFYKPNRGGGRFGPLQVVAEAPPIEGGRSQLVDLDADGRLEFATLAPGVGGFFDRTSDAGWTPFRPFRSLPIVDFTDPNVRLADLSGDGFADILITDDQALTWHPSLGDGGFGEAVCVRVPWNDDGGPRVLLGQADQSIVVADMSGDGLPDLVRIRNGEVCYWPSLGHGRFGPKVTMDGSPWFDDERQFDARRLRLADTDGSGPTDLIYAGSGGVRIFLNESGNALSAPRHITGMALTEGMSLDVVDLLGRGTACLVWSTALPGLAWRPVRFIDLMDGEKPHLLVGWENQLGAETRLTYASSTEFYLADRAAGRPWATRLPFPVHVVTQIETIDHVSRNFFVTTHRYHHGHYDGVEREFRGFGMVEQIDAEHIGALDATANWEPALRLPPVLTKTWFHTGHYDEERRVSRQFADEYYREPHHSALLPDTIVPPGLTFDETREACRALKGSVLRQEIYALDDSPASSHPYSVTESNFTVRLLQPRGRRRYAIFDTHARERVTLQYERKLFAIDGQLRPDPRVTHQLTLRVDGFGNVLESAAASYGRRYPDASPDLTAEDHSRQAQPLVTCAEVTFSNPVSLPDAFRAPFPAASRTFELGGAAPESHRRHATNLFTLDELRDLIERSRQPGHELPFADWRGDGAPSSGPYRRLLDHQRTRYRANRLDRLLDIGDLESMALPGEEYRLAFPAGLIAGLFGDRARESNETLASAGGYVDLDGDGNLWRPSGRLFYCSADLPADEELREAAANFFLPRRVRDPFGGQGYSDFDPYRLLLTTVRDALDNRSTFDYDYRLLAPFRATDRNGNRTAVALDTLGLVAATAVMGKDGESKGDSLDDCPADLDTSTIAAYFDDPFRHESSVLGRASSRVVYDIEAFARDGRPTVAAALQRETHVADLGHGDTSRVQHGLTYSDGFGREIQKKVQAEPGPLDGRLARRWAATGWTVFNNKGKPVRQYEPFFTATHRFEFDARRGISPTLVYDPLGRVVAVLKPNGTYTKVVYQPWRQETWDENDTILLHARSDRDLATTVERLPEAAAPSWYDQRIDGGLGRDQQDAAVRTATHAGTPVVACFDSLGRTFLTFTYNRSRRGEAAVPLASRAALDIENAAHALQDALGRVITRYEYDVTGRRIYRDSVDSGRRWMLADVADKPLLAFDAVGRRMLTVYDVLRRPIGLLVREPDGSERRAEQTVYGEGIADADRRNLRGQPVHLFDAAGVVTNEACDFKGNLLSATRRLTTAFQTEPDWQHAPALEDEAYRSLTSYDALNRATSVTLPNGTTVRSDYNDAGLLRRIEVTSSDGAAETFVTGIDYNARAQRERIDYGNGASTEYEYDPLTFRTLRIRTTRADDGARLQDLSYVFDPIGNITAIRDAAEPAVCFRNQRVDASADFEFDALYRLIRATGREHALFGDRIAAGEFDVPPVNSPLATDLGALRRYEERFAYDAVGNLTELLHSAEGARWRRVHDYASIAINNRLTGSQIGSRHERFTYDAHGNTTSAPHLAELAWSFKDHLQSTRSQAGNGHAGASTHYRYDAAGRRVRKTVVAENGDVLVDRIYLGQFELERRPRDGEVRELVGVMDGARRIAILEGRGAVRVPRFQLTDHLASVSLELNGDGKVLTREEYYPYGETSFRTEPTAPGLSRSRYRFAGQERDDETGFSYLGARYYAAWLGRWTSCDPEGLTDGSNLYAYCRGNPICRTDLAGTDSDWCVLCNPFSSDVSFAPWQFTKEEIFPRGIGALKAVGGGVEAVVGGAMVVGGVASSEFGIGVPIAAGGTVVAAHGLDTFIAGLRQIWSGEDTETFTSKGLQAAGVSPGKANLIDAGVGVVFTFGGSALLKAPAVASTMSRTASATPLVHLTTDTGEAAIAATQTLGKGTSTIYAGPAALADAPWWAVTARTGLLPSKATSAIMIPQSAAGVFRTPAVVGPFSAWQRISGTVFSEGAGSINLVTGAFTKTGRPTHQLVMYGLDAMVTGSRLLIPGTLEYAESVTPSDFDVDATGSWFDPGAPASFEFSGTSPTPALDPFTAALLRPEQAAVQACYAARP